VNSSSAWHGIENTNTKHCSRDSGFRWKHVSLFQSTVTSGRTAGNKLTCSLWVIALGHVDFTAFRLNSFVYVCSCLPVFRIPLYESENGRCLSRGIFEILFRCKNTGTAPCFNHSRFLSDPFLFLILWYRFHILVASEHCCKVKLSLCLTWKHLTTIKTKHRNRLNLQPALILALVKIRLRMEVLACHKQAESYN
jgi:hypothetical protein